jgi:uncharacterized protein (DUF488 family)
MFYRRKIILSLLQIFGGNMEKIKLQKLLFLITQRQQQTAFDFVPYKYGCYSYSANADLGAMVKRGFLIENRIYFKKADNINYLKTLKPADLNVLNEIHKSYGKMSNNDLIKHTYINFPYWATKSEIADKILTNKELKEVKNHYPSNNDIILFTIGYEGISLEEYLNRLVKNNVKLLVDVRQNPLSMKFGFSKTLLKRYCESLDILYVHFPEVGIDSKKRKDLKTQNDYDILFSDYKKENLSQTTNTQLKILNLLKKHQRIALTCFEANICQCHRKPLAESIKSLNEFSYTVKHI